MLDLLLKLIDKLVELLKEREAANRRMFEDHIEPIYKDVQTIVDDYRQVLSSVMQQLEDPTIPLDGSPYKTMQVVKKMLGRPCKPLIYTVKHS
jgi:hypothetical protein